MQRPHVDITRRERPAIRPLPFDSEIALLGVGVFEVLIDRQSERKDWTEADKCLVVEANSPWQILSCGRNTWSCETWRRTERITAGRRTNRALENLKWVQQLVRRRTSG